MPSRTLFLWARCGGLAAAPGPQKEISGAAVPPPNPHRITRVNNTSYAGKDRSWGGEAAPNPTTAHVLSIRILFARRVFQPAQQRHKYGGEGWPERDVEDPQLGQLKCFAYHRRWAGDMLD